MTDADRLAREQQAASDVGTWVEILSTNPGDYYADSIEVEKETGALRFHTGGYVVVLPSIRAVTEQSRTIAAERDKACQCVCHKFPGHGRLQDALDALKWHQTQLAAEREEHKAGVTRAVLNYTARGYRAGENTDAKHWRERAEQAEVQLTAERQARAALERIAVGLTELDWCIGYELTEANSIALDNLRDRAFKLRGKP